MLILDYAPALNADHASDFYQRAAREGMVHSSIMRGEHYDISPHFNEAWASPAVTWSCGGEEAYHFSGKRTIAIRSAGALSIAAGDRYAYDASAEASFRSNMIIFPRWFAGPGDDDEIEGATSCKELGTKLFHPTGKTLERMAATILLCIRHDLTSEQCTEQLALLYQHLIDDQHDRGIDNVDAAKRSTRAELARRIDVGVQFILECYGNPALTIPDIASAACLSRFHLIRVFKAHMGQTPIQYLTHVRLAAAMRLLTECAMPVKAIAAAVGYENRTAFSRAFTRHYGAAPSSFR